MGVNGQARLFVLTPFVPLSRGAGEGERAAPLSHAVGEGLGVRAIDWYYTPSNAKTRTSTIVTLSRPPLASARSTVATRRE